MSKFDPGTKQTCPECSIKFYDLNKRPAVCPKCEHSYNPDAGVKPVKKPDPAPVVKSDDEAEDADTSAVETETEIEGLDAEDEEAKSLELDGDKPVIMASSDDDDDSDPAEAGASLPEGFTEEGVEDDSDALADNEEEIDIDDSLETD